MQVIMIKKPFHLVCLCIYIPINCGNSKKLTLHLGVPLPGTIALVLWCHAAGLPRDEATKHLDHHPCIPKGPSTHMLEKRCAKETTSTQI